MAQQPNKKPAARRPRQARSSQGKFESGVEPVAIEREVGEKTVTPTVAPKVSGPSDNTAGKYGAKPKVGRPGFGSVRVITN